MTTDSDPYSNAVAERVNGIIKNEFNLEKYKVDLNTLQKIVAQTIKIYNNERVKIQGVLASLYRKF